MRCAVSLVCALALVMFAGCDSVTSIHKIGQPAKAEVADQLTGTWVAQNNGAAVHLQHIGEGQLIAAGLQWDDQTQQFKKHEVRVWLTEHQDHLYLNMLIEDEDEAPRDPPAYHFFRCTLVDDHMLLHAAKPRYYAGAIEDGQIDGTLTRGDHNTVHAVIEGDQARFLELLDIEQVGRQFEWKPTILRRVGGEGE